MNPGVKIDTKSDDAVISATFILYFSMPHVSSTLSELDTAKSTNELIQNGLLVIPVHMSIIVTIYLFLLSALKLRINGSAQRDVQGSFAEDARTETRASRSFPDAWNLS